MRKTISGWVALGLLSFSATAGAQAEEVFDESLQQEVCATFGGDDHLVAVSPLPDTWLSGNPDSLQASDGCYVAFIYGGPDQPSTVPVFGIEAEFSFPPGTTQLSLNMDLHLPYDLGPVGLLLKDHLTGRFVRVASFYPDVAGKVEAEAMSPGDPSHYLDPSGSLFARFVVEYSPSRPGEDKVEVDQIVISPF